MGTDRPARRPTMDAIPDAGVASKQPKRHQAAPVRTAHHGSGPTFNPRVVGSSPTGPTPSEMRFFWTRWHEGLRILGVFAATGNGAGTDLLVSAAGGQVLWERPVHDRLGGPKSAGPFAGRGGTRQTWASAAGQRVTGWARIEVQASPVAHHLCGQLVQAVPNQWRPHLSVRSGVTGREPVQRFRLGCRGQEEAQVGPVLDPGES